MGAKANRYGRVGPTGCIYDTFDLFMHGIIFLILGVLYRENIKTS